VLPSGSSGTAGFPAQAVQDLAWSDLYACLYIAAIGLLAIAIGLTAFRRGEKWAWYSILVFVLAGAVTGLLDYLSWGGWYTSVAFGLPAGLGLLVSARTFFQRRSTETSPSSE
jgi:CHASE2 domain-containing sensor protein